MKDFDKAQSLIHAFKEETYLYGLDILDQVGEFCADLGSRVALVCDTFPGSDLFVRSIQSSLLSAEIEILNVVDGAKPNAPREDLARITNEIKTLEPDFVISFGGGSTIDATKAAVVLCTLGGEIEDYFGVGCVTNRLSEMHKKLMPHVAIQTIASSGAHLTKYSNITDIASGQKKLIVDEAIIPLRAVFDYKTTFESPLTLTMDGALDGFSHALEVLYGAASQPDYEQIETIAVEAIRLVVNYLPRLLQSPHDPQARKALGLATDLGGYAIMRGGTNGAHLTSFSLVDVLSHGRACGIMNPYYTVFFAPAIERPLLAVASIFIEAGIGQIDIEEQNVIDLGVAVAEAMIEFERLIGFPTTLGDVPGFTESHIERALTAAKNPQLKMKLENMPIPLTVEMVDDYMLPVLEAAKTGDLSLIKNLSV